MPQLNSTVFLIYRLSLQVADVMLAAHFASEVASRLVKPTATNYQVTDAVQKVADSFGCKPIDG